MTTQMIPNQNIRKNIVILFSALFLLLAVSCSKNKNKPSGPQPAAGTQNDEQLPPSEPLSAAPPTTDESQSPAVVTSAACAKSDPNYFTCRYNESLAASASATVSVRQYACTNQTDLTTVQVIINEYAYSSGAKPADGLLCDLRIDGVVKSFANQDPTFCLTRRDEYLTGYQCEES